MKENKTNAEKINKKKGLYHYQNNPKKEEKRVVDKRFETRTRNPGGNIGHKQANTVKEKVNSNDTKKKEPKNNKKTIVKQFSNHSRKRTQSNVNEENSDNDALVDKMQKRGNNSKNDKKLNNNIAYTNENHLTKENELNRSKKKINNKNAVIKKHNSKLNKNGSNKPNELVQNLIDDFDQTMEEYSNLYCNTTRGNNKNNDDNRVNNKSASKRRLKDSHNKRSKKNFNNSNENKLANRSVVLEQNGNILRQSLPKQNGISLTSNLKKVNSKIHKDNNKNKKKDDLDDLTNSEHSNAMKIKRSKANSKFNLREDELPLYKGEIDYNNVSIKNITESIDDLFARYKKKGFTCIKKGDAEFKFVKGPNTHIVEIMRLGNGLLYFNITK